LAHIGDIEKFLEGMAPIDLSDDRRTKTRRNSRPSIRDGLLRVQLRGPRFTAIVARCVCGRAYRYQRVRLARQV
jgi:hypothetical protein